MIHFFSNVPSCLEKRKGSAFLTTGIILLFLVATIFYVMSHPEIISEEFEGVIPLQTETTEETQTPHVQPTQIQSTTTTTQKTTEATGLEYASNETNGTLEWLEKRTFDLVNYERTSRGLNALKWNEEIAEVCRMHSKDMADNNFFSHTGSDGSNSSYRLFRSGVYYWNLTGENIAKVSSMESYIVNSRGEIIKKNYRSLEEIAQTAVEGWMNSPEHRTNILRSEFDEAGMGVYEFNESYYFTQNFIRRVQCGYKGGHCCETEGYLPWCYEPWECVDNGCK